MDLRTALQKVLLAALDSALVREQECRVDPEVQADPNFTFEGFSVTRFKAEMTLTYKREDGAIREVKVNPEVDLTQGSDLLEPTAQVVEPAVPSKPKKKAIARTQRRSKVSRKAPKRRR